MATEGVREVMIINTTRFGEIEVSDASVLHMAEGMLGFEWCKRFVLLEDKPNTPFKWLQAVDDPAVAFIVINPMEFFPDYEVELADDEAEMLGITNAEDAAVVTTVTIDKNEGCVTTNLLGPIIINSHDLKAKQIVLNDDKYGTKHVIGQKDSKDATLQACKAA